MSPLKMIEVINSILERSGIHCTQHPVDEDFMGALTKVEGKKAGNPEFDPSLHELGGENSFWIGCHDRSGELIGTGAARLLDVDAFMDSCRCYRLWYGDRIRFTEPLEIVTGQFDRIPAGRASLNGAIWVRPDWRGCGLSWAVMRLCHFTAMVRWQLDWVLAMVYEGIARAGIPAIDYGFPRTDLFANGYVVPGFSRQQLYLLTMTRREALALAACDHQDLANRPDMLIDRTFGERLRAMRLAVRDIAASDALAATVGVAS